MTIKHVYEPCDNPMSCHVCGKPVDLGDVGVVHYGCVVTRNNDGTLTEDYSPLALHTECATVLAMRLIHDVVAVTERPPQTPLRVIELLRRKKS